MSKRTPYEVRKEILGLLLKESALSYTKIQTKLSTNYDSVKNNLKELEEYGLVKIKEFERHSENGRPYFEAEPVSCFQGPSALDERWRHPRPERPSSAHTPP